METIYQERRHAKYNINYHFIWIPKYRKKNLNPTIANYIKKSLYSMEAVYQFNIIALEVMSDHIHLQVSTIPKHSPAELINKIKGKLGYELTKRYPHLNTGKGVWSTSYFCATTGNVSSETIKKYIENQMIKMYNL